jgi:hypothetical protein
MRAVLCLVAVAILLAGCEAVSSDKLRVMQIEQEISKANRCTTDADCSFVASKCPFGCHIYVNNAEADRIRGLVDSYDGGCVYDCLRCDGAQCSGGKCTPVCPTAVE